MFNTASRGKVHPVACHEGVEGKNSVKVYLQLLALVNRVYYHPLSLLSSNNNESGW